MASRRRLVAAAWIVVGSLVIYLLVRLTTQDSILAGLLASANCAINWTALLLVQVQGKPGAVRDSSADTAARVPNK